MFTITYIKKIIVNTMGKHVVSTLFLFFLTLFLESSNSQQFTSRYDHIDIDKVLNNNRILNSYIKCLLGRGPCTNEGKELKRDIPEALATNCARCTAAQKRLVKKAANFLMKNRPEDWKTIARHFNPTGQNSAEFRKFLSS